MLIYYFTLNIDIMLFSYCSFWEEYGMNGKGLAFFIRDLFSALSLQKLGLRPPWYPSPAFKDWRESWFVLFSYSIFYSFMHLWVTEVSSLKQVNTGDFLVQPNIGGKGALRVKIGSWIQLVICFFLTVSFIFYFFDLCSCRSLYWSYSFSIHASLCNQNYPQMHC